MCDIRRRVVIISNAVDLWVNKAVIGKIIVVYNTADRSGLFDASAFSSPEPLGPLSRWRLGTRTKWLWGHRIAEVLDSRTSGIHV